MTVLISKTMRSYLYVEVGLWNRDCQKSVSSLKPLFSLMSFLNVFKYCFYHKPHDKFEIITFSVTHILDLFLSKYKSNEMLKSKAHLSRLAR